MPSKSTYKPSQCVPSGLMGGKDGIIVPSNAMKTSNGYISPQWGWYISTTPPTPEKYAANRIKDTNKGQQSANLKDATQVGAVQGDSQKPVFTRQIKGVPKNVSDWPSVPL